MILLFRILSPILTTLTSNPFQAEMVRTSMLARQVVIYLIFYNTNMG